MKRIVQGVLVTVKKAVGPGRSRSGDWGVHGQLSRLFVLNLDCCVRHSAPENIRPHTTPDQENYQHAAGPALWRAEKSNQHPLGILSNLLTKRSEPRSNRCGPRIMHLIR